MPKFICAWDNVACHVEQLGYDWSAPTIIFVALIAAIIFATILEYML